MAPLLYLETNFALGFAKGQDRAARALLDRGADAIRLVLPTVCFLEALGAFEAEQRFRRKAMNAVEQDVKQIRRNLASPHPHRLVNLLELSQVEAQDLLNETGDRLRQVLSLLAARAEFLELTPMIVAAALADRLIPDGTDNLILHAILDHARGNPGVAKAFLTANTRDFDRPEVREALRQAGVDKCFARTEDGLGWSGSRPS